MPGVIAILWARTAKFKELNNNIRVWGTIGKIKDLAPSPPLSEG
jgi:hypothetical protein